MKRNLHLQKLSLVASVSAAAVLAACGGGGGSSGSVTAAGQGTVNVALTDAPACGYDAVNVTVSKVRIHSSSTAADTDQGWTDIPLNPARKINLLNLTNGLVDSLGQTALPAGHYSQLRLVLDPNTGNGLANSVVVSGTTNEVSLDTPSAVQSGIKLINEFDVAAGQQIDLVLDFDACKSVVTKGSGKYALKPVVKVAPTASLNGIDGYVNKAALPDHVMVTAQQNGVVVSATAPNPDTGKFYLTRLAPGNYDVVITADRHASTVIANVPVASTTSTVSLSTSDKPMDLPTSGTATLGGTVKLTPASTTDDVAYVAAKQSFSAGPTVTIKYRGADVSTGAYTLDTLPTAAPQFAQYSPTLPLVLTTPATTPGTGKYAVEASMTGYQAQTATVDVSGGGTVTKDFALTK